MVIFPVAASRRLTAVATQLRSAADVIHGAPPQGVDEEWLSELERIAEQVYLAAKSLKRRKT